MWCEHVPRHKKNRSGGKHPGGGGIGVAGGAEAAGMCSSQCFP